MANAWKMILGQDRQNVEDIIINLIFPCPTVNP